MPTNQNTIKTRKLREKRKAKGLRRLEVYVTDEVGYEIRSLIEKLSAPRSNSAIYKANERMRKKAKGLQRIGMWVSPENAAEIRAFARSLEKQSQK